MTKKPFVDIVLHTAGQKGTGKWTSVNALDMAVPAPNITAAADQHGLGASTADTARDAGTDIRARFSGRNCDFGDRNPSVVFR